MQIAETQTTLGKMPLGGRLIVRSKKDWRVAVVSRIAEASVTLSIASPTGYNYRVKRTADMEIGFDGIFPILKTDESSENWRRAFSRYDPRW